MEFVSDGLDHLDGDNLIELSCDVAVVFNADFKFIFDSLLLHALAGILGLFFGDGDAGDLAAICLGRVGPKPTPTAANFENMVGRLELELLA